jgi:iron complex outermembrane receptor protein
LFGRNTTGGAINFITKKPDNEASLKLKLGAGNYGQMLGRFVLNSGDLGGARMSLGYLRRERNGIVDNLLEPKDSRDPGSSKVDSARWAVEIDLADNITAYNVLDWTQITGQPHFQQLAEVGMGVFRPNISYQGNTFAQVNPANVGGYLATCSGSRQKPMVPRFAPPPLTVAGKTTSAAATLMALVRFAVPCSISVRRTR